MNWGMVWWRVRASARSLGFIFAFVALPWLFSGVAEAQQTTEDRIKNLKKQLEDAKAEYDLYDGLLGQAQSGGALIVATKDRRIIVVTEDAFLKWAEEQAFKKGLGERPGPIATEYSREAAETLLKDQRVIQRRVVDNWLAPMVDQLDRKVGELKRSIAALEGQASEAPSARVPQAAAVSPDTPLLDDYYNQQEEYQKELARWAAKAGQAKRAGQSEPSKPAEPQLPKGVTYDEPVGAPKRTKWSRSDIEMKALLGHLRSQYQKEWHDYWCKKRPGMGCPDLGMHAFAKLEVIVSNWGASNDVAWRLCQTWLPRCLDDCVKADGEGWGKNIQDCQDDFWREVKGFRDKGGEWPIYKSKFKFPPRDIKYLRHRGEQ